MLVGRRPGAPGGRLIGLLAMLAAAADKFRAADQDARIDAGRPADQAEHDNGSDAEAAAAELYP